MAEEELKGNKGLTKLGVFFCGKIQAAPFNTEEKKISGEIYTFKRNSQYQFSPIINLN